MPDEKISSLELDRDSLEGLGQLLEDQYHAVKSDIETATADIKRIKVKLAVMPDDRTELTRQLVLAEAKLKILEEQMTRRDALEIVVGNARPAVLNLVVNGEQACRHNPHLTKNQFARAEVAYHFSTTLLERINKPATASSPDILHELNRVLSSEGSLQEVINELSAIKTASEAILEIHDLEALPQGVLPADHRQAGLAERYIDQVLIQMFFVRLKRWFQSVAGVEGDAAILLAFLGDLQVKDIPREIDWPRALPFSHEIPNIYPVAQTLIPPRA